MKKIALLSNTIQQKVDLLIAKKKLTHEVVLFTVRVIPEINIETDEEDYYELFSSFYGQIKDIKKYLDSNNELDTEEYFSSFESDGLLYEVSFVGQKPGCDLNKLATAILYAALWDLDFYKKDSQLEHVENLGNFVIDHDLYLDLFQSDKYEFLIEKIHIPTQEITLEQGITEMEHVFQELNTSNEDIPHGTGDNQIIF